MEYRAAARRAPPTRLRDSSLMPDSVSNRPVAPERLRTSAFTSAKDENPPRSTSLSDRRQHSQCRIRPLSRDGYTSLERSLRSEGARGQEQQQKPRGQGHQVQHRKELFGCHTAIRSRPSRDAPREPMAIQPRTSTVTMAHIAIDPSAVHPAPRRFVRAAPATAAGETATHSLLRQPALPGHERPLAGASAAVRSR